MRPKDTSIPTPQKTSRTGGGKLRGEVLGVERRWHWDDGVKLANMNAVGTNGPTVTKVAQRHDVMLQQIYIWRHKLKHNCLWSPDAGAPLLPADKLPAIKLTVI